MSVLRARSPPGARSAQPQPEGSGGRGIRCHVVTWGKRKRWVPESLYMRTVQALVARVRSH